VSNPPTEPTEVGTPPTGVRGNPPAEARNPLAENLLVFKRFGVGNPPQKNQILAKRSKKSTLNLKIESHFNKNTSI
jgi:hypothetical protein